MYFPFSSSLEKPQPPANQLAYEANYFATYAKDSEFSYRNLYAHIENEFNHPTQQKIRETLENKTILIYFVLTLAFFSLIFWEWDISRPIYQILSPSAPMFPFICCVVIAFYISTCLSEYSPHFSRSKSETSDKNDIINSATRILYHKPNKPAHKRTWYFSPVTGTIIAAFFLLGIYLASHERVILLKQAGDLEDITVFQEYLPVILYVAEIILGIPAFLFFSCLWSIWRSQKNTYRLSQERLNMINLRRLAVGNYSEYLRQLKAYNTTVPRKKQQSPILPNKALRQLFTDEFGYDPTAVYNDLHNANQHEPVNVDSQQ